MINNINYGSINNDLENGSSDLNNQITNSRSIIEIINSNVRLNALKNLIKNGAILGVALSMGALANAYVENELTDDKFNSFQEFIEIKRIRRYLTWGLTGEVVGILLDKFGFNFVDEVYKASRELLTGTKYLTDEEKTKKDLEKSKEKIKELEAKTKELEEKLQIHENETKKELLEIREMLNKQQNPWSEEMKTQSINCDNHVLIKNSEVNLMQL